MEEEEYSYWIVCENCRGKVELKIPKGVYVSAYLLEQPLCPRCGCKVRGAG